MLLSCMPHAHACEANASPTCQVFVGRCMLFTACNGAKAGRWRCQASIVASRDATSIKRMPLVPVQAGRAAGLRGAGAAHTGRRALPRVGLLRRQAAPGAAPGRLRAGARSSSRCLMSCRELAWERAMPLWCLIPHVCSLLRGDIAPWEDARAPPVCLLHGLATDCVLRAAASVWILASNTLLHKPGLLCGGG